MVREPDVVEQRTNGDDFPVVHDALQLPEPNRKEPRSDGMVEEHWLGMDSRILNGARDERRVGHRYVTQHLGGRITS
jgi:hypothetical protein